MDSEDRDHFKTIASQQVVPQTGLSRQQNAESSRFPHDQASCLEKAKAIFGCYRRDEAHDPDGFVAALTAILSSYPAQVVDFIADPRTGVANEYPMGLPNVGQIASLCNEMLRRFDVMQRPKRRAIPLAPVTLRPNEINSIEFNERVSKGLTNMRPIGAFEPGGYLGPKNGQT